MTGTLLTTVEVAERLGLSSAAVAQAVRTGALQPTARTADDFLFSERAVAAFAERRARAAASPLQPPAAGSRVEWTGDVDRLNSWLKDLTEAVPGRQPVEATAAASAPPAAAIQPPAPEPDFHPPPPQPQPVPVAEIRPPPPPAPVAEIQLPPRPVPDPEPGPEIAPPVAPPAPPAPEPEPPQTVPEPEPVPPPEPEPEPETVPEPNPIVDGAPLEAAPAPVPEPAAEPEPALQPAAAPEPPLAAAAPQPEPVPQPEPIVATPSQPAPEAVGPAAAPAPEAAPAEAPDLLLAAPIQPAPSSGLSRQAILVIEPIDRFRILREVADRLAAVPGISDARLERLESGSATYRVSFGESRPSGEAIAGALAPLGLQVMLVDSQ